MACDKPTTPRSWPPWLLQQPTLEQQPAYGPSLRQRPHPTPTTVRQGGVCTRPSGSFQHPLGDSSKPGQNQASILCRQIYAVSKSRSQVVVPRQLRDVEIGRHRLQFLYQSPKAFAQINQLDQLDQMKSDAGFAKVAGVELTLLDCARYFHKAAGINGVAQIAKDIGAKASPRTLAKAAASYENSSVRRLGYQLEQAGHTRQANALEPFVKKAMTAV